MNHTSIYPGFKRQVRHDQKSKIVLLVAQQKGLMSSELFLKDMKKNSFHITLQVHKQRWSEERDSLER